MLDYQILERKPQISITDKEGVEAKCKDLLSQTVNPDALEGVYTLVIVNKYYVARPDLISLAIYSTDEYADIICKVNGISNPFELNENDVLMIPDIETIQDIEKVNTGSGSDMISDEETDSVDTTTDSFQKRVGDVRMSCEQLVGENNYVVDRSLGMVFY